MPWFKVDDGFHSHPKVQRAGNAAVGLWLRCGTYSSRYLLDGHVPTEIARSFGKPAEIGALTRSGLWLPGDDGYVIRDYLDYQPSAEQVRRQREHWAEIKRTGGEARAAKAKRDAHGHFVSDESDDW